MRALTADALSLRDAIAAQHPRLRHAGVDGLRLRLGRRRRHGAGRHDPVAHERGLARRGTTDLSDTVALLRGTLDMCYVRVFPLVHASAATRRTQMGHEMYHCLHKEWGKGSTSRTQPAVGRGEPRHVDGHQVAPGDLRSRRRRGARRLLRRLERPVGHSRSSTRTYDGARASSAASSRAAAPAACGTGVTERVGAPGRTRRRSSPPSTGSNQPDVLDTLGLRPLPPALASRPAGCRRCRSTCRAPPAPEYCKPTIPLGAATERLQTTDHRADMYVVASAERPLVKVDVAGHGRVTDGTTDWPHPRGAVVLLRRPCECPPGQHEQRAHPGPRRHRRHALRRARRGRRHLDAGARAARACPSTASPTTTPPRPAGGRRRRRAAAAAPTATRT